jgi:hypothetical protein
MDQRVRVKLISSILAIALTLGPASAADGPGAPATAASADEVSRLKSQLAEQRKQLEQLTAAMAAQQKLLDALPAKADAPPQVTPARTNLGEVASLAPIVPSRVAAIPAAMQSIPVPPAKSDSVPKNPCEAPPDSGTVPSYLRLGGVCIVPVGFMDLTSIWRDKDAGSAIGSNFAGIPYGNTVAGHLSEFRFSPQNSRIGFRIDGDWNGTHFIGYNEFDFLGTSASNGIGVTNGAFVPRIRLFWIDVRKDKWEFLGGQSWSMLTPNRKGISALPGDLFYSQVIDVNYMAGLTWTRQPGVRVLFHANSTVTAGFSVENPNQYAGGQAGSPQITPPTALAGFLGTQLDNASSSFLSTPNLTPDFIAKVAVDPSSRFHGEIAGILRTFKTYNLTTNQSFTKTGGGVSVNANVELVKSFRLVTNNYWSDGGGRYLFGTVPDVILRADGSVSPIYAGGTVDGFEWSIKNTLLYAYYGGIYAGRNVALDANGTSRVGYGYTGAANSQNRAINEASFGFNQTMWKSPRYGAVNLMGQYAYEQRNPWYVAPGSLRFAHDNSIYINLRYTLPGFMPIF